MVQQVLMITNKLKTHASYNTDCCEITKMEAYLKFRHYREPFSMKIEFFDLKVTGKCLKDQ